MNVPAGRFREQTQPGVIAVTEQESVCGPRWKPAASPALAEESQCAF